jgi:prepilin signal peptidase PulO-like enzyme (type II secretory pathway)
VIVFWAGAMVGSFLGVVIWRLPLIVMAEQKPKDFSLTYPPSHCPRCNYEIPWWQNVPIFGFLFLRGRCWDCKTAIPWRDFAMEILTACVWTALFHRYNTGAPVSWVSFVFVALFASLLIAAVFIDLDHFIVPDEMNWWGVGFGIARSLLCIATGLLLGGEFLKEQTLAEFTYFGWLPRAIPGALLYAGVLWLVAFGSFLYYARVPWESLGGAARRFFTYEDAPPVPDEWKERVAAFEAEQAAAEEAEGDDGPPVRLRFSPGFITILSALFLGYVVGWWSVLAIVIPLAAFVPITRAKGESVGDAVRRFFKADDLPYSDLDREDLSPALPAQAGSVAAGTPTVAETQEDADQFAREAESGAHGGMGMGDVKLALGIGAILGPFPAMLSLFFATLIGAVVGLILKRVYGKTNLRYGLPFVPFMAAGALLVMLFGQRLVTWYQQFLPSDGPPAAVSPRGPLPARPAGAGRPLPPPPGPTPDPLAPYR